MSYSEYVIVDAAHDLYYLYVGSSKFIFQNFRTTDFCSLQYAFIVQRKNLS